MADTFDWNDHDVVRGEYGEFRYRAQVVELKDKEGEPTGTFRWGASAGLPAKREGGGGVTRPRGNHQAEGRCESREEAKARSEAALQLLIALVRVERGDDLIRSVSIEWK